MVVSIANQKGGVGKTTTLIMLANYLAEKKELITLDFDFQASLYNFWKEETSLIDTPPPYQVIKKDLAESKKVIQMLKEAADTIFLLDLPGKLDDNNLIPLIESTDVMIVPFTYDKISVESTLVFVQVAKHLKKELQIVFIPNRIKTSVKYKTKDQTDTILSEFGMVTEKIPDRVCFQRLSFFKNNQEIKEICNPIFRKIEKLIN